MKFEDKLRDKIGTDTGYRVPEGYFEDAFRHIAASLPDKPAAPKPKPLSAWQKVRPYVYLAAMFAGIWCMMKVFHTMSTPENLSLDNPPALVAEAVMDDHSFDIAVNSNGYSEYELMDEMSETYTSLEDFKKDFYNVQ